MALPRFLYLESAKGRRITAKRRPMANSLRIFWFICTLPISLLLPVETWSVSQGHREVSHRQFQLTGQSEVRVRRQSEFGQNKTSVREVSHRPFRGLSDVSQRSVKGQSEISQRSVKDQSEASQRSVSGQSVS